MHVPMPRITPCVNSECQSCCPRLASSSARQKRTLPTSATLRGENRLAHCTTSGAPSVISEMDKVSMRSNSAAFFPENGFPGSSEMIC